MSYIVQKVFCKKSPYHNVVKKTICNDEYLLCVECNRKEKIIKEIKF